MKEKLRSKRTESSDAPPSRARFYRTSTAPEKPGTVIRRVHVANNFIRGIKEKQEETKRTSMNSINRIPVSHTEIQRLLNIAFKELQIEKEGYELTRDDVVAVARHMGLVVSQIQATEALLHSRLDPLPPNPTEAQMRAHRNRLFDCNKLVTWVLQNVKILREWKSIEPRHVTPKVRFRPRIDREVEVFRILTKRDLEENPNFIKDVQECLYNLKYVP